MTYDEKISGNYKFINFEFLCPECHAADTVGDLHLLSAFVETLKTILDAIEKRCEEEPDFITSRMEVLHPKGVDTLAERMTLAKFYNETSPVEYT